MAILTTVIHVDCFVVFSPSCARDLVFLVSDCVILFTWGVFQKGDSSLSENLNSGLTNPKIGNSEFTVSEQLNRVSSIHSEYVDSEFSACTTTLKSHDQWSSRIMIHHGNSTRQKDFRILRNT